MLESLRSAAAIVYRTFAPTAQRRWPTLDERCGARVWVKHEQQAPTGAFKVRGGLVYLHALTQQSRPRGVVAATRGNHGQSIAFAAKHYGLPVTVVVPHGNSGDKNRAMRALGADLVERGHDFQAALEAATELAAERGWHLVPSFDELLVRGVASYSLELLEGAPEIETMYVPIGLGSGICGAIAVRDALHRPTKIVGVVSSAAPAYARSLERGEPVSCESRTRIADGVACRTPNAAALDRIRRGAERVVEVSDEEVEEAMRVIYDDTHTVAEGAAATSVAALLQERRLQAGRTVAVVLTGSNVDRDQFARVLTEHGA
jgi:threonine dehydratase